MRYHVKVAAKKKIISTTAIVAGVLMFSSTVDAQTAPPTNSWDYDTVVGGNVGKDTSVAGITDITVTGGNGYVAGNADIYHGHTVNVTGDTDGSTFAYRDNRDTIQSRLDGNLNSNMNVIVIDRDGLWFTSDSVIDVNGLIATTGNVGKNDLMNGDDVLKIKNINPNSTITNNGQITAKNFAVLAGGNILNTGTIVTEAGGQILLAAAEQVKMVSGRRGRDRFKVDTRENGMVINTGTMDAGNGGLAAIVSPFAINSGIIRAKAGTVAIAAGETVTLDMYGDGLVELAVDGELSEALITNLGKIAAKGGVVNITAKAAKNTVDNLINNEGIITASSATVSGGKIILGGGDSGTIRNAGKIRTSDGGSVDINGERFLQESTPIPPAVPAIKSGGANINIATTGDVVIDAGNVNAQGGNVAITNDGTFTSRANAIKTQGAGTITLTQNAGGQIQNAIDAIKNSGTGENTVNVGAGTYNEAVVANVENLNLKGANAGANGAGIRGAESIITPNSPGVHVTSDKVTVDGFKIVGGDDGIYVENVGDVSIINNIVENSTDNGIEVDGGGNITVEQNVVLGSANNGIKFTDTTGANINLNLVALSGDDGIDIDESFGVNIKNNIVGLSFDDGIDVNESGNVSIDSNLVLGAADNGIEVSDSDGTEIKGNAVGLVGNDGINVGYSDYLSIADNIVGLTGGNGITVSNGSNMLVYNNQISYTGDDGIDLNYVEFANVVENEISNTGDDGIDVDYGDDILIAENSVSESDDDGVSIYGSGEIFIYNNTISQSGDDGIDVENTGFVDILENTITESEDDGVDIYATSYSIVANNEISDSGDDGVHIAGNGFYPALFNDESRSKARVAFYDSSAVIDGNTIENSGGDGVQVDNLLEATIIENIVNESAEHGLYVSGASNGYVQVQGNEFNDNGDEDFAQARFESGDIDLSDVTNPNAFTKTTAGTGVAMQFDDISGGFSGPIFEQRVFVDDIYDDSEFAYLGTGLRIVDETLGSTEFTGYTGTGNFYVRLEDGTLLDPLTSDPIVIDGTNASFDGIIPSSFAGTALPLATLQFIEDRLYDADDASVNGRGQIFTGLVETIDGPANFQDFLPFFNNTAPLSNFASVTINGLPSIGDFGGGPGALNNIAPAAGEQNDEQELADIEPSAGGNGAEVTCIEDAVNGLGLGSVTYNFGGSFEDTIAGAVGCQSGEI